MMASGYGTPEDSVGGSGCNLDGKHGKDIDVVKVLL